MTASDQPQTDQELAAGTDRPVLLRAATVLSGDPAIGDLASGDVLITDGRIAAVGADLSEQAGPGALVVDAAGTIAIPGFVDAHVHAWEGLLRGIDPQADFGAYLGLTAFGYGPKCQPEHIYAGTLASAVVALDAGVTTLIDNAHNALTPDHIRAGVQAVRDAGIRAVHAVGSPFGADLPHVPSIVPELAGELSGDLVSLRLFEVNPSAGMWAFAQEHDLWISTELGPHTPDIDAVMEDLHHRDLLGPKHAFNHAYDLAPATWDLIAASGAAVNLAPRSDAQFGLGTTHTPLQHAMDRGMTVGLSGDNELSYGLSMFAEMSNLASRYRSQAFAQRASDPDMPAPSLGPGELLGYATLGGAQNAGLADQVGTLTPGKQADVVLIRADAVNTSLVQDPTTAVTAFAHSGNVDTVFVAGRLRKRHGKLIGVDVEAARDGALTARERLTAVAG